MHTPEAAKEITGEVGTKLALSRHQVELLYKCREDSMLVELMTITGRSDRTKFRHQVLNPLLEAELVEMTLRIVQNVPTNLRSSPMTRTLGDQNSLDLVCKKMIEDGFHGSRIIAAGNE